MTVHLAVRSSYSLLDSTIRISRLVQTAVDMGYDHVALTDHNVMHGIAPFSHACRKAGIQPIYGLEADCAYHDMTVPFLLLAKDNRGYQNLMLLSSLIGDTHAPCSLADLCRCCPGCFLIAYGEGGWLDSQLIAEDRDGLIKGLQIMKEELPAFDMALSYQEASLWKIKNALLKRCCQSLNIRTVALNKIYYLRNEDAEAYRITCGIRLQKTVQDQSLPLIRGRYFRSPQEMAELYEADDLQRTDEIAAQCTADLQIAKTSLPEFHAPAPLSSGQYLTQLCLAGLKKRLHGAVNDTYMKRLKYELSVILKMKYADYFLIVWDFIRYARLHDIYVGPGRGSAAGSLVAYCLGITQVDPLKYHLLFERFLNPERVSMPDIDTDIPDNRREEVIQYVYQTYGAEHIANIVTFGTLGARQVIRDVGRVLNLNVRDTDMLCRMIPNTPKITLNTALKQNPRLAQIIQAEDRYRSLLAIALQLEGLPRHVSIHAAGIIMSSKPISSVIPTMQVDEGMKTSQYTMEYLEERGLIKMDFLGLRNLTIIDEIVRKIHETDPSFNIMKIPLDNPEVYQLIRNCDTIGIFQLESEGMKNLLHKMQPTCFEDIVAAISLFRPASMENIQIYLNNRAHPENIQYPAKALEPILKETYGVMIYQEQTMLTAQIAAGFTLAQADLLRKAMAKKKEAEIDAMRTAFLNGCRRNGYTDAAAEQLFELTRKFGGYGFNKSHAVAYSLISYQMAYLKVTQPLSFYCALLDSVIGDDDKSIQYIDECRRRGIKVCFPDINQSSNQYAQSSGAILLPLSAVKTVGFHAAQQLIDERSHGQYTDFFDFVARASLLKISRRMIENLICAGALDSFGQGRRTLLGGLDDALSYADLVKIEHDGQVSINLGLVSKPVLVRRKDEPEETSENEKAALGFCLGPHPIIAVRQRCGIREPSLITLKNKLGVVDGFALIQSVKQHRTRRGEMMAFLRLSDETGELEMAVMPSLYKTAGQSMIKGNYIRFHGKIEKEGSCLADRIQVIAGKKQ